MLDTKQTLELAYNEAAKNKERSVTDILVAKLDSLCLSGNFEEAQKFLDIIDLYLLPKMAITGILTLSWHVKEKLGNSRVKFLERAISVLETKHGFSNDRLEKLISRIK